MTQKMMKSNTSSEKNVILAEDVNVLASSICRVGGKCQLFPKSTRAHHHRAMSKLSAMNTSASAPAKSVQCASVLILSVFFTFCFTSLTPTAHASLLKGPVHKLGRGIVHIATAILQLPKEVIQKTADASEPAYLAPVEGFFVGMGSGVHLGIRQLVSGFADIFTFYTPLDRDWGPIYEPATFLPEI
jgi:putative exosortase-associated protein (TIGR04073 family)